MFWIVATVIALVSALLVCLPLLARGVPEPDVNASNDAEVYRDQLSEVDRDETAGLIDAEGRWLIPMGRRFRSVTPFRKGLAKVILNDKRSSYEGPWVTIRPDGRQVRGK